MLILPCLLLLVAPLQVASQLPAALLELHRHEIVNAKERGAVCNDGSPGTSMHVQTAESRALPLGHSALKSSTLRLLTLHPRRRSTLPLPPASYYFRDCPRPGAECASGGGAGDQWFIIFEGGSTADTCIDDASCAARQQQYPQRMT